MAYVEDFSVYFTGFGDDATLAGETVRIVFDAPGAEVLGLMTTEPSVQIKTDDVPDDVFGAALVITTGRGLGSYTVREHVPDGTGMSLLLLTR